MAFGFSTATRNSMLSMVRNAIDAGGGAAKLQVYTATRPATGAAITSQTKLLEYLLAFPCAPVPAGGVLTFDAIASVAGLANGTAAWFRIVTSADVHVCDGSVTVTGGGGEFELDDLDVVAGNFVAITAGTITAPSP